MSATTLTQTTIKTQWLTACHHQPLLVPIQAPPADLKRRATPLRCSARLSSQTHPQSPAATSGLSPPPPKSKRRRASSKHCRAAGSHPSTSPLSLSIPHSALTATAFGAPGTVSSTLSVSVDPNQPDPAPARPARKNPFPSLKPLQALSPIADNPRQQPKLSFAFFSQPHRPPPLLLSFPATPLPAQFVFHFPLPTPVRHLPPPHPGQRHSVPLPAPTAYHLQPFPTWSITSPSCRPQSKRRLALPQAHHVRSKKIKLHHSFFRSPQVLYPVNYATSTPGSFALSSRSKPIEKPKWLHTSAAADGQSSKMRPREAQYTGNPESWIIQSNHRPRSPLSASKVPKFVPLAKPHGMSHAASPAGPQVAPLKAQLLAVLRMHSNHQPGEAALRLKKWVIWNSWVRGCAQMRYYPIANPSPPNTRVIARSPSPKASGSSSDGQRGDEDPTGQAEAPKPTTRRTDQKPHPAAQHASRRAPAARRKSPPAPKSHTVIKLKIPAKTATPHPNPIHPTPPLSPVSPSQPPSAHTKPVAPGPAQTHPVSTATQNPLTPPPSPPNH
ncbi:hypothetical protein PtA15_9A83 [Puccinia triticina]|uniref:Uncharacterized protein n=1 Tax=Puccinia triticina TaxID=208348 RepID=A0ABY7CRR2_9BASI|nr:uncharacterized protein PtA15_9A83 [Puccinia triticina]WAQ87959.1 hypothetical protein PtA15_9A83 [Puccinia triticina]